MKIRNCPFCGRKAILDTNDYAFWVRCSFCELDSDICLSADNKEDAVRKWNSHIEKITNMNIVFELGSLIRDFDMFLKNPNCDLKTIENSLLKAKNELKVAWIV